MINTIKTAAVQTMETRNATVVPFKNTAAESEQKVQNLKKKTQTAIEEQRRDAEIQKSSEIKEIEESAEKAKVEEVSQAMLDELSTDLEMLHSVGLSFSKHEDTGRTVVKVVNKDTEELIREIPSEQILNMAAKFDEMVGLLFDIKV